MVESAKDQIFSASIIAVRRKVIVYLGGCYVALICGILIMIMSAPMRAGENVTLVATIMLLPALLFGREYHRSILRLLATADATGVLPLQSAPVAVIQRDRSRIAEFFPTLAQCGNQRLRSNICITIILGYGVTWFCMTGIVFAANKYFDHNPTERFELTALDKHVGSTKGGRVYKVFIESPVHGIFPFGGTYRESLRVSSDIFRRVVVGQSLISIDVHRGIFGLPWYSEPADMFNNLAPSDLETKHDLTSACLWRVNFNIEKEIGVTGVVQYRRVFYPNGTLRSEEPLINNQLNGVAHYWFGDGKTYGDIPYKNGGKHGYFKLYREDGSLEQLLSYRDGHLYGISEWYKPDGSLDSRYVYLADGGVVQADACDAVLKH
jgi:hypothetical protein